MTYAGSRSSNNSRNALACHLTTHSLRRDLVGRRLPRVTLVYVSPFFRRMADERKTYLVHRRGRCLAEGIEYDCLWVIQGQFVTDQTGGSRRIIESQIELRPLEHHVSNSLRCVRRISNVELETVGDPVDEIVLRVDRDSTSRDPH